MKSREQINRIKKYGFTIENESAYGGEGIFRCAPFAGATVVWTYHDKHVSICTRKHAPSWDDMCKLKDMFYNDEEEVWQCHPKKSEYVNLMENCLHLWEGKLVTE